MNAWQRQYDKKIIAPEHLAEHVTSLRQAGKTIATINGSFDLLHAGHLTILCEASELADVLIVALNDDNSIKGYKSPDRPIISLPFRLQMIAALSFVDYVTWFSELNPIEILSIIKPDIHVNGSEYGKDCIEKQVVEDNGGKIHIVDLVPGLSTSQIVNKIQGLCG